MNRRCPGYRILHFALSQEGVDFAAELVKGAVSYLPELDAKISEHSSKWRIDRMDIVDKTCLGSPLTNTTPQNFHQSRSRRMD